jgi:diphosphomevalonate decarboxylase
VVSVFAPVNIAWIKYMGKENGLPTNASLSMTLEEAGTKTSMHHLDEEGSLHFVWSPKGYVPPIAGQQKAEQFLKNPKIWRDAILALGYVYTPATGLIEIETSNSVPAGTGIATSASGFAALALAWIGVLLKSDFKAWKTRFATDSQARKIVAGLAAFGSGSACRSIDGPFVEWDPRSGTKPLDTGRIGYIDFILLLDQKEKVVPSTEAHARVRSSPKFAGRVGRAHARLAQVKDALKRGDLKVLAETVLVEALDMHDLFHTSDPSFGYMNDLSRDWVKRFQAHDKHFPSQNGIVTLDAGANVHVFVPDTEERLWERFFQAQTGLAFVKSRAGKGARYVESRDL